ncbi:MAG: hypothetical protein GXY76_21345 [Chloroflexi bacterium]|nr:hypothetical protein [Chloroflexota bacterium]
MPTSLKTLSTHSPALDTLLEKHRAFWRRDAKGFLRAVSVFAPSEPSRLPQRDGRAITQAARLTPDMFDVGLLIDDVLAWDPSQNDPLLAARQQVLAFPGVGDLLPLSRAFFKIPWLEAMLGCPITMTEGQIWVGHYEGTAEDAIRRGVHFEGNPWFQLYVEFLHQLQARLEPRYLASANTLLRGTCDLVAAILGVKEACVGWIEQPRLMARLLRVCTDANLAVIEAGRKALRPFQGGYMSAFGVWAPEYVVRTQADHSTLLSPRMYREQILPFDREVIAAAPHCIFHIHNNGYHIAPDLVQVPELDAIEVVVDPYPTGARKAYEIVMMQMILQHKALLIDGNFPSYEEAEWVLAQLDRRGLYYNVQLSAETLSALPEGAPHSEMWLLEE